MQLPDPLGEYFTAANTDDADRIAACFAEDARVHDEQRDHVGRDAIRRWASAARTKYSFRAEPFERDGDEAHPVVRGACDRQLPRQPGRPDLPVRHRERRDRVAVDRLRRRP